MVTARFVTFSLLVLGPIACGGGGGGGGGGGATPPGTGGGPGVQAPLLPSLMRPTASVAGGAADGASGTGTDAGTLKIASRGGISIDPPGASGAAPAMPPAGAAISAADLGADLTRTGTIQIDGKVTAGGTDAVRTITSSAGDILVAGTLRAADLGATTQGLSLSAPEGTVYVVGGIDTSGASKSGAAGGPITIAARNIVVVGTLDASGGESRGDGPVAGGAAGAIRLTAGGDVWLARVLLHGGGAKSKNEQAVGGAGATLTIDADGALQITELVDARGGPAVAGGAATAGAAGGIVIGASAAPSSVALSVGLGLEGGSGPEAGGAGGPLTLTPRGGDLRVGAPIDVGGGHSRGRPGKAGTIDVTIGPDAGGFALTSQIRGDGGSADTGGSADGALGARVRFLVTSPTGGYDFAESAEMRFDGGDSSGTGTAGGGGDMEMIGVDGDFSLYGKLLMRGGAAPDPGGTGGEGGIIHVWSDSNHNGVGGNITIQPTGLIEVSGGPGTFGGSGRNNQGEGVALFPVHMDQLSVLLDGETIQGNSKNGVVNNLGRIVSRGGANNGHGGDTMFHGRNPDGSDKTVPGNIDMAAHGTGMPGSFAGE